MCRHGGHGHAGAVAHVAAHHHQLPVQVGLEGGPASIPYMRHLPHDADTAAAPCPRLPNDKPETLVCVCTARRYGTDTTTALRTLYKEGGVRRFYRGLLPAMVQGPLSR